jgi:hypothetical protein
MAERRQYRTAETENRGVGDAGTRLIVQVANSRRSGIVGDRIQRSTRQIEKQGVMGLVEESDGISFQIVEERVTSPQVAHRHLPAILPIFVMGKIAELQTDEKRIFPLDRAGIPGNGSSHRISVTAMSALRNARVMIAGASSTRNRSPSRCP